MTRVVQISDTHLSPTKRHFVPNWAPLRDWVAAQAPQLVIHTGDVTVDGADTEEDMRYGAECLAAIAQPLLVLPGNHDVGEAGHRHQPVNAPRLDRWRRHFGQDWWMRDVEGWRLIGLDSMIFGSGLDEEARQQAWLEGMLAGAEGRRIAVFTHRPFMLEHPEESDAGYWTVKQPVRRAMLELFDRHDVALVASGHIHRAHDMTHDARRYIWGAASSFLVGPEQAAGLPGEARLGAVTYDFRGKEVTITGARVPGLSDLWIDDVAHEVYPPRPDPAG
jgi:3',5'-cyclic AMP phosphodiesterase CpdA